MLELFLTTPISGDEVPGLDIVESMGIITLSMGNIVARYRNLDLN
jgi:hypothetical protein